MSLNENNLHAEDTSVNNSSVNFLKNERNELHFLPLAKLPVLGRSHAFSRGEQNFKMKREREAVGHLRPTVEGTAENGPGQGHRP
jgi:hypothetical protein